MANHGMNEQIGVVGAGLIGRSWAIVFARAGFNVTIHDSAPEALSTCLTLLRDNVNDLAQYGLISETPDTVMGRITPVDTLAEAMQRAALVQENVSETLEAKQAIFAEMDRLAAPETILVSSTSWIPASSFSAALAGRGRIMVGHPVNPPHLVPLVELAPAPWTTADAVESARDLYARAGQTPVLLKKEITGFLLNRIQGAVLNEAFNLYAGGYASIEDLDNVMKNGLGMRWSFMGPFETIDLNAPGGIADYAARYGQVMYEQVCSQAPRRWKKEVIARLARERRAALPASDLAQRQAWRDRRLMALAAHKREASKKT